MYDELVKRLREYAKEHCPRNGEYGICGCIDAREAADAIEELSKPRWIPVTERMPKPYTEVMVAFDDGKVYALWQDWEAQDERDEPLCYMINPFGTEAWHTVTHWMPLPPAPEPPLEES